MFTVDSKVYSGASVISLERRAVVEELGASGYTLSKTMLRDIAGVRFEYTVTLDSELMDSADYDLLFDTLASASAHTVSFPYGGSVKSFTAYVREVRDEILRYENGSPIWGALRATFVSVELS